LIKKIFPIIALAMFSSNLGMGIVSPLLPLYARNMGASGIWIGVIVAAYGTTSILSTPLFGRLSDQRGRKIFLCIGLLCYAFLSLGYIWADSIYNLILVRLFQGAAGGMVIPIAFAYIGDLSPAGDEGKWTGYANAAFFSGFGIGPLLGGVLTDHYGITTAFYFMGALNLIAFIMALILLPVVKHSVRERARLTPYREMIQNRMVLGLFVFQAFQAVARGAYMTFLPLFGALFINLSPTQIGLLLSINMMIISFLGPVGGVIADRFNRRWIIVSGSILILVSTGLVPLTSNFWHLLILSSILAVGSAIAMAGATALSVNEGRKFGMGSTMGFINMGMNIGMAVGPIVSGELGDIISYDFPFFFGAFVISIGTIIFISLSRREVSPEEEKI
jgi:DHA1 family multidrug resistance protein-like MFS transporter